MSARNHDDSVARSARRVVRDQPSQSLISQGAHGIYLRSSPRGHQTGRDCNQ
jgi:hypothetical protein